MVANHAEFLVDGDFHRVGAFLFSALSEFVSQPPVAGVPGIENVPVRFAGHGVDGFVERRDEGQFLFEAPDQVAVYFIGGHAVQSRHQIIGRVAKKPRPAEDICAAVTRQQGAVGLGMVKTEWARIGRSMRFFATLERHQRKRTHNGAARLHSCTLVKCCF